MSIRCTALISVSMVVFTTGLFAAVPCEKVEENFTAKVEKTKESWRAQDGKTEKELSVIESQILTLQETGDKNLIKNIEALQTTRTAEKEKLEKSYSLAMEKINKEIADLNNLDAISGVPALAKQMEQLEKKKEEIARKRTDLEKIRDNIDNEFLQNEEKINTLHETEIARKEDEDRKQEVRIEEAYQKEFDTLNAGLTDWDKKDEAEKAKLAVPDKEIETYALAKAAELEKIQQDIEKRRDAASKNLKDDALENEMTNLDMELAKKADILNKDLKKYREAKLAEKKKQAVEYAAFLKKKETARKQVTQAVEKEQKKRDDAIALLKKEREKKTQAWAKEAEERKKQKTLRIDKEYNAPKTAFQKEIEKIETDTVVLNNKIVDIQDANVVKEEKLRAQLEKKKQDIIDTYDKNKRDLAEKFDSLELKERQTLTAVKEKLDKKRRELMAILEKARDTHQKVLDSMKEDYIKAKKTCQ